MEIWRDVQRNVSNISMIFIHPFFLFHEECNRDIEMDVFRYDIYNKNMTAPSHH